MPPPQIDQQLDQARLSLENWHTPKEFQEKVQAISEPIDNACYFRSQTTKFLRDEAWILAEFSILKHTDQVRLARKSEEPADGYIQIADEIMPVQVTEADRAGRKRAMEYKNPEGYLVECVINEPEDLVDALDRAISNKASKKYDGSERLVLLVNHNMTDHGRWTTAATDIASVKERYATAFRHIYVLRNGQVF